MAKKHNGLLLLGAAAVGAAVGAYFYFKKTDADRFDDDDFDFDDFDDLEEDEDTKGSATRSYVPLNLDSAKPEETDAKAHETSSKTDTASVQEAETAETIEEFFDEEDEPDQED